MFQLHVSMSCFLFLKDVVESTKLQGAHLTLSIFKRLRASKTHCAVKLTLAKKLLHDGLSYHH